MSKAILIISIACFLFLLSLQMVYYFSISHQIIQIVGEILTLPSLIFVILAFFFSLINVLRKKKEYNLILGINVLTIFTITIATILEQK